MRTRPKVMSLVIVSQYLNPVPSEDTPNLCPPPSLGNAVLTHLLTTADSQHLASPPGQFCPPSCSPLMEPLLTHPGPAGCPLWRRQHECSPNCFSPPEHAAGPHLPASPAGSRTTAYTLASGTRRKCRAPLPGLDPKTHACLLFCCCC